jgi:hypothetical protein
MANATLPHTFTKAEQRVLVTLSQNSRCVGGARTVVRSGFVNTQVARALVRCGIAAETVGVFGDPVFLMTEDGYAAYFATLDAVFADAE